MENVYFIVGPHGVGKTYLVNEIRKINEDVIHVDTGPLIREIHASSKSTLSLKEWVVQGENLFGVHFTDMMLSERIKHIVRDNYDKFIIITGNRSIEGIKFIVERFKIKQPSIIFLDAPFYILKNNYEEREKKGLSNIEFGNLIEDENRQGLQTLKNYVFENEEYCHYFYRESNSDITNEEIYNQVILKKVKQKTKKLGGLYENKFSN